MSSLYSYKHHIIPLHEWRKRINSQANRKDKDFNAPDNVVWLSLNQHAQVHDWLFEQYGALSDKIAGMAILGNMTKEEIAKAIVSHPCEELRKNKLREAGLKYWASPAGIEAKQKRSGAGNHRYGKPGNRLGATHTESAKIKMRKARAI
jgi:hypothetical protein